MLGQHQLELMQFHQDSTGKMDGLLRIQMENGKNMTSQQTTNASWTCNAMLTNAVLNIQILTTEDA
jgi:hypothetical protein